MQHATETTPPTTFVDRRKSGGPSGAPGVERRQFQDGTRSTNPEVAELANAIDKYKIENRRRFITFDEIYQVMVSLGYHK